MFETACPCCGKPIRRLEDTVETGKPWYRLARVTSSRCPRCKAELRLSRISGHLSGAHSWACIAAGLFALCFVEKGHRGDFAWIGILAMLAFRLLYLLKRSYVPAPPAATQGGG